MVFATVIIFGVAGAMLGWNVHVMRKHGVSRGADCGACATARVLASVHTHERLKSQPRLTFVLL